MVWRTCFAALCIVLATVSGAGAHPHVYIEMTSDVVFNDQGLISAINVEWVFDPDYTAMATEGLDVNKDGEMTTDELEPLAKENIEALKEWSYFVYGRLNGQKLKWADVTDYGQLIGTDGRLRMHFVVPAEKPIDPKTAEFLYRIYDPTFYIAIDFVEKDPVEAVGKIPELLPDRCRSPARSDQDGRHEGDAVDQGQGLDAGPGGRFRPDVRPAGHRQLQAGSRWMKRTVQVMLALALVLAAALLPWSTLRAETAIETPAVTQPDARPQIDRSKLLVGPRRGRDAPSPFADPAGWIIAKQQQYYRAMSLAIRDIQRTTPWLASFTLIGLSFGYGVFHAAGPGHGKAVVSAWLLGNEERLRRGITIAFLSAFIQALTAILLVSVLVLALGAASEATREVARWLEVGSYLLISGLGLWLVWQAVAGRMAAPIAAFHGQPVEAQHRHDHGACDHCGHAHLPAASALDGAWSWRRAFSIALAIGDRPCTGALLVLLFSSAAGIYWAGVVSTFVMALGTALTVSLIAAMAVGSRRLALGLASRDAAWAAWTAFALKVGAGTLLVLLGLVLAWGTLQGNVGS